MKEEDKIIERFGKKGPWRVPEGYFESVRAEIEAKLPAYPEEPKAQDLSVWMRMRPYVYLAAMFAGIWLMMSVFHRAGGIGGINLDNPPEQIAQILSDREVSEPLLMSTSLSDVDLLDEISGNYQSMEDFEEDFGYDLEPEFENIDVEIDQ